MCYIIRWTHCQNKMLILKDLKLNIVSLSFNCYHNNVYANFSVDKKKKGLLLNIFAAKFVSKLRSSKLR